METLKALTPSGFSTSPWYFNAGFQLSVSKSRCKGELIVKLLHLRQQDKLYTHVGHKINAVSTVCGRPRGYAKAWSIFFSH